MTMKIMKASSKKVDGGGYVLFGNVEDGSTHGKWFERWYPTREKAEAFADRKGWKIIMEIADKFHQNTAI